MDAHSNHGISASQLNSGDKDELNMINPILSQSSHASPYNLGTPMPCLSNPFPINPNQSMPSNQFPMSYGFHPTNFNPHLQQACSFQGLMNSPIFPFETQMPTPSQKKGKKQKNNQKCHNIDSEPHQPIRRNWTKEEDVALTKAWLHISIDPIIGTDQSNDTMWKRIQPIWKEYLAEDFLEDRPIGGLSKRWCTIQGAVNKFHGIYEQLGRSPRSGSNLDDIKRDAHKVYKEMSADNKPFLYEHCWDECKKNAKWCIQMTSSKRQKTNAGSPSTPNASSSSTDNEHIALDTAEKNPVDANWIPRPLGRKSSKEKKKIQCQDKSMVEVLTKMQESMQQQYIYSQEELELKRENTLMMKKEYELREQAMKMEVELKEKEIALQVELKDKELALQKELQKEAQRRRNQQNILNQDLGKLTPAARVVMEKMQERIMKEWTEEDFGQL